MTTTIPAKYLDMSNISDETVTAAEQVLRGEFHKLPAGSEERRVAFAEWLAVAKVRMSRWHG